MSEPGDEPDTAVRRRHQIHDLRAVDDPVRARAQTQLAKMLQAAKDEQIMKDAAAEDDQPHCP